MNITSKNLTLRQTAYTAYSQHIFMGIFIQKTGLERKLYKKNHHNIENKSPDPYKLVNFLYYRSSGWTNNHRIIFYFGG